MQLIIRNDVVASPFPDLFLARAKRLAVDINDCIVVGDSIWDLLSSRRAHALESACSAEAIGRDELVQAAYRVWEDPGKRMGQVDEPGVQVDVGRVVSSQF